MEADNPTLTVSTAKNEEPQLETNTPDRSAGSKDEAPKPRLSGSLGSARARSRSGGSSARSPELLEAKNERKKMEQDVLLLMNRLKHLKKEESKALKKVEETKKRVKEIETAKKRNVDHHQAREQLSQAKTMQIKAEVAQNLEFKQSLEKKVLDRKQWLADQKKHQAKQAKEKQGMQRQVLLREKKKEEDLKREKTEKIRREEELKKARREAQKKAHQEQLRAQHAKRVQEEQERKALVERKIAELEAEEARLIERLKSTQVTQRTAYDELRTTLSHVPLKEE